MSCRTQYRIQKRNEKQTMYETCGLGSNSKQKRKASDTHFRKCFMHPFACQTHTCLTYIHLYAYKYIDIYIYSFMCVCVFEKNICQYKQPLRASESQLQELHPHTTFDSAWVGAIPPFRLRPSRFPILEV